MCCHRAAADSRCRLHQSIFIFTCAASRCSESAIIVHQSHRRRSGTVDLRFKMIIFKSCPIGPDRLHAACSCALCRARCFELRLPFVAFDQSYQTDRVWQLRSTALVTIAHRQSRVRVTSSASLDPSLQSGGAGCTNQPSYSPVQLLAAWRV